MAVFIHGFFHFVNFLMIFSDSEKVVDFLFRIFYWGPDLDYLTYGSLERTEILLIVRKGEEILN